MRWDQTHCVVCGLDFGYEVRTELGGTADTVMCPSCFAEVGNEDYSAETAPKYRQKWIKQGYPWKDQRDLSEDDWNSQELLQAIPPE